MTQDIRLAFRAIIRAPSYAALVIGSLAVGIAAPVLAFSVLNAIFFRPLDGIDNQDGLVRIMLRNERDSGAMPSTYDIYTSLRDQLADRASIATSVAGQFAIAADTSTAPALVRGEIVSANYFDTLTVRPAAGRLVTSDREAAVVISHTTWQRHFQSRPDVVGQFLMVNGRPLQVMGVAPERFEGLNGNMADDGGSRIWLPIVLAELALRQDGRPIAIERADRLDLIYVGRLRAGVTLEQLERDASAVVYQQAADSGAPHRAVASMFSRVGGVPGWLEIAGLVLGIMALPFLVLAIACVNGGNMVLARATRMTGVWSLQLALGASRRRLLRQPIIEGLLLALLAAAGGLVLTRLGFVALNALIPFEAVIDLNVVAFTFAVAVATPLLFGVGPVWSVLSRTRHTTPGHAIRVSPRSRARTLLLVAQAAMCVALLGTGTQFLGEIRDGLNDGLGPGNRMLVGTLDVDKLAFTHQQADDYYRRLLDRVQAVPGAARAGLLGGTNLFAGLPLEGQASIWLREDAPDTPRPSVLAYVTPYVLNTIGAPLLAGRMFTPDEHVGPLRSVMVNEPFVRMYVSGSPVGQTIRLTPRAADSPRNASPSDRYARGLDAVIVGVVRGASGARHDTNATIISPVPLVHLPARSLYIPFDDASTLTAAAPAVREAIRAIDPRVPYRLDRLDDARWGRSEPRRFMAVAVAALGGLALLLAAIGLYGAIAYVVELRTREIGVRMAIGATSSSVLRTITGQGMIIAVAGCGIGIIGAIAFSIVMRSQLYGASRIDPLAFGGSVVLMLVTMFLASIIPARRAARVDPAIALRAD